MLDQLYTLLSITLFSPIPDDKPVYVDETALIP
ncbi:hypothetical protein J2Z83_001856 [Virgibacillus natechei]|uniref:Transposase n=1 Tax=Virgibacillus natechei TaxID=1216297 RepID=A0ABS4IFM9_9BACI|nr:hypothetical protein [Virgibacillus natechei]